MRFPYDDFHIINSQEDIMDWIFENIHAVHNDFPRKHSKLIKSIANSNSPFSPFYQTVDIGNERIIEGQTRSHLKWDNIKKLDIEWDDKNVCELGCNNGYFLFKAEELGAICDGYDREKDSINLAIILKKYKKSKVNFYNRDVCNGIEKKYDIVMVLNVLHYIDNVKFFLDKISNKTSELIFEIGKDQIEIVVPLVVKNGLNLKNVLNSHRKKGVLGERVILHFSKN